MISKPAKRVLAFAAAALPLVFAAPAAAQDEVGEGRRFIVTVGGGAMAQPKYPGAEDYGIYPLPIIGLRREGQPIPFEAPDDGFGFGLLRGGHGFNFGPDVSFVNKRRDRDVGAPVGNVGVTVEAGAFAEVYVVDQLRLRVAGRKGLGGHDGWVGDISADLVLRRGGDRTIFSIGPRARLGDGSFHRAYFGVTPAAATATGLPAFNPGGGFYAVGANTSLTQRIGRDWGVYGFAGYDRLVGDAADSPIVRAFGSRDQFSGGLGLFYEFGVGRR